MWVLDVDGFLGRANKDSGVKTDWERARFLCDSKLETKTKKYTIKGITW